MKFFTSKILIIVATIILASCGSDSSSDIAPPNPTGQGGSLARIAIVGQTMYFVDNSKIQVFDITTPETPVLVNTVDIFSDVVETIFHHGEYLYLGSSNGMFIYSIRSRHFPEFLSSATHVSGCDPVVSDGKFAYVTVRNTLDCSRTIGTNVNILEIFNVENPRSPQSLSVTFLVSPAGLAIDGDILFVCDDDLKAFDVSDRSNPVLIKTFPSSSFDIIIDGDVILTVDSNGINQYIYDRDNLELTLTSTIITS